MKTLSLITAFLLLFSLSARAQQERSAKNTTTPPAQGEVIYQPVETSVPVKSAILGGGALGDCFYYGDPCGMYLDKNWTGGEAKLLDGTILAGEFRYNVCGQKMEAIVEGDTFAFARPGEIDRVRIGDKTFVYANYLRSDEELASSWFEVLCEGNCSLMLRRFIKYRVTDGDADKSNDLLYRLDEYYSCSGKKVLERLYLDKKDVLAQLKEHQSEVTAFIRSEHLNVKKHDDLVKVFSYYNQLD